MSGRTRNILKDLLICLRVPHWIKNLFVVLPLVFGHKLLEISMDRRVLMAFMWFCLASSTGYMVNDLLDYQRDRVHQTKRFRPIAAGRVSPRAASLVIAILGALSLAGAWRLDERFGLIVITYLVLSVLYTNVLKHLPIIDVICLGLLFTLRIVAGGVVADVALSPWIILMTGLLALFLGFAKRRQELRLLGKHARAHRGVLVHYSQHFLDQMILIVTSSLVVGYALYTMDPRTTAGLGSPRLMVSIPFVYYGIFRYLYLIYRRRNDGDPTGLLFIDRPLQINLTLWLVTCSVMIYGFR